MNPRSILAVLALAGLGLARPAPAPAADEARVLAHDVYFTLRDASPEAARKLVDACHRHLAGHEGNTRATGSSSPR